MCWGYFVDPLLAWRIVVRLQFLLHRRSPDVFVAKDPSRQIRGWVRNHDSPTRMGMDPHNRRYMELELQKSGN